jgi:hypothetical protein
VVAFSSRVDLAKAAGVAAGDGNAFRRRRMTRRELEALLSAPDEARLKDL